MSFDRLARPYRLLERLAFGRDLENARYCLLESLAGRRRILILGEGDGRFLARLLRRHPDSCAECVEASAAMIARARARLTGAELARVRFRQEDALLAELGHGAYDAAVTLFFLDCFTPDQTRGLVGRVRAALKPGAPWLFADFALPPGGWRRWRARLWVGGLYLFFRMQTGLAARRLPPSERLMDEAGFTLCGERILQAGLLRASVRLSPPATRPGAGEPPAQSPRSSPVSG